MIKKVAFIGAGSMAEAIIAGIIREGFLNSEQIAVTNYSNRERLDYLHKKYRVHAAADKKAIMQDADIVILSMKPADVPSAIQSIKDFINPNQLLVSVAAGVETDFIASLIGENISIIRAMPNTSATVGLSATALSKGKYATDEHLRMTEALFNTVGITEIVSEEDMHTVTAVSGSGPAYFYYIVEAMEKAALDAGLDKKVAKSIIVQTIIGAGEMLKTSGETAETLRKKVTSPGGTTEAGLKKLAEYKVTDAVHECIQSARNRSIELGDK